MGAFLSRDAEYGKATGISEQLTAEQMREALALNCKILNFSQYNERFREEIAPINAAEKKG